MSVIARHRQARPRLELKIWPSFHPVTLCLSMVSVDMENVVMPHVFMSRVMAPLKAIILKTLVVEK
jgi:hypothetical protein